MKVDRHPLELESGRIELQPSCAAWAVELPHVHRVSVCALVRCAPRFETRRDNGLSHFLEHMLHRGIVGFPTAPEQALAFEALGGSLNACTSADHTALEVSVPKENFRLALDLLARLFQRPIFSQLELERGIVREEILESLDENNQLVDADSLLRELVFDGHPLGYPIAGTLETLQRFEPNSVRSHHERFYVAPNCAVGVAGPVRPDEALSEVAECFRGLRRGSRADLLAPSPRVGARFRYVQHVSSQTSIRLGFLAASVADTDHLATEMLLRLLDDGMSTRLYRRLCDERGLCYDVSAGYEAYDDSGVFELSASGAHEHAGAILDELLRLLDGLQREGPTADELHRARQRVMWQARFSLDQPDALAAFLAAAEMYGETVSLPTRVKQLCELTEADLRACAQRLFSKDQRSVLAVGLQSKRSAGCLERSALTA